MKAVDLENIIHSLSGCHALLCSLCETAEHSKTPPEAIDAVDNLLVDAIEELKYSINNAEEVRT